MRSIINLIVVILAFSVTQPMYAAPKQNVVKSSVAVKSSVTQKALNLNTASMKEMVKYLRGIGKAKAQSIVHYREQFGAFKSIDELIHVRGMSKGLIEKVRGSLVL